MRIKEVMTEGVTTIAPTAPLREAAQQLAQIDAGVLPVEETDRVKYCFEDDDVEEVAKNMADLQVRRLPVLDKDKRLVGIVSLADIATAGKHGATGKALEGVTRPGGQHNQANGAARA